MKNVKAHVVFILAMVTRFFFHVGPRSVRPNCVQNFETKKVNIGRPT